MGDRAVVRVESKYGHAPCEMYLHGAGSRSIELVRGAIPRMREGDEDYSMARLIGHCHEQIDGNRGLGVLPYGNGPDGDAGLLVYNCSTGKLVITDGYQNGVHQLDIPPS